MKKGKICIGTVLLILSLMCLTGCSSQEPEETTARQTTSAAETSEKEEDRLLALRALKYGLSALSGNDVADF